ncbi:MAG: hypothetical protein AAFO83_00920 [Cyanobacteria bacterium J06607_13]
MFYAAGNTILWGGGKIRWVQPASLSVSEESEEAIAQGVPWDPGVVQDLESAETSRSASGEMNIQRATKSALEVITNSVRQRIANLSVPGAFQQPIESDTVTVTGLTVDQLVTVGITQSGSEEDLTQVFGATSVTAGTYKVTADTITFNTGDYADGVTVTGVYFISVERTIVKGRSTAGELGNVSFYGKILGKPDNAELYIPKLTIPVNYTLPFIGAAGDDITVPMKLLTDTENGFNNPYEIIYL